jgi:hypothetical protein
MQRRARFPFSAKPEAGPDPESPSETFTRPLDFHRSSGAHLVGSAAG